MTSLISEGQVVGGAWVALAWGLIILTFGGMLLIRKARARGRRLFRDEPTARVKALHQDTSHLHEQDAVL
jgi:hypothetical protein